MAIRSKHISFMIVFMPFILALGSCSSHTVRGDIRITDIDLGVNSMKLEAIARNIGPFRHPFPIGASLQSKDYTWLDLPFQVHEIQPGESAQIRFDVGSIVLDDFVLVRVAIWTNVEPNGSLGGRLAMDERSL